MKAKTLLQELTKKDVMRLIRPYTIWVGLIHNTATDITVIASRSKNGLYHHLAQFARMNSNFGDFQRDTPDIEVFRSFFNRHDRRKVSIYQAPLNEPIRHFLWYAAIQKDWDWEVLVGSTEQIVRAKVAAWARERWNQGLAARLADEAEPPRDIEDLIRAYFGPSSTYLKTGIVTLNA